MQSNHGFTLIELVTTLAILAILLSFAIPNVIRWKADHQIHGATTHLMHVLQHARLRAVKDNKKVIVSFDPDADGRLAGDYLIFVDNGLDKETYWTQEPDEPIVYQGHIKNGIEVLDISFAGGKPRLRFDPLGLPNGLGGHIYLSNGRDLYLGIHVNLNGSTRMVRSRTGERGTWR
jgi:prepilin-type N-terminal cleavage/methylation domain-containing protein